MFRHIVLLTWKAEAPAEDRDAVPAALATLPGAIAEIRSYCIGDDVGVNLGNADLAVVADFDSLDGYLVYRDHPAHQAVIRDYIAPILGTRSAIQFPLDPAAA